MLAIVEPSDAARAAGEEPALHRTYLNDRGGKADVSSPRKLLGRMPTGAAVRLAPYQDKLGIAEGIETSLAASTPLGAKHNHLRRQRCRRCRPSGGLHLGSKVEDRRNFGNCGVTSSRRSGLGRCLWSAAFEQCPGVLTSPSELSVRLALIPLRSRLAVGLVRLPRTACCDCDRTECPPPSSDRL